MYTRRAPHRYGNGAGFTVGGLGRVNHVKKNHPKAFPGPPPLPCDLRGVRHAQLQEKIAIKLPPPVIPPRTKYRRPSKKEILLKSLRKALTPPEVQVSPRKPQPPAPPPSPAKGPTVNEPKLPGALTIDTLDPEPAPLPEFGAETAKHYADELRQTDLDEESLQVLRMFEMLKFQGETRDRYHENAVALDKAVELQPQREKFRAMDCAHAAKREKRYQAQLAEAKERAEQERKAEEARLEKERKREEERKAEEERKRQEREAEEIRRISWEHQRQVEERILLQQRREEERQRKLKFEQERARLAAEARRAEQARRAKEAEMQRRSEEKQRVERERFKMLAEMTRLKREREEAERRAKQEEERRHQAVYQERRAALEALRQATREANEMMAQWERDQAAKDAYIRAAEYRAHLMEQELRAREQHQWAQAQAFMEQLEQAHREHAILEQACREIHERYLFEQQQRGAREAQERAEREQREAAEAAAREAQERAAQAAREAEAAANQTAIAQYICNWYDHRWDVLKTRKDIDGQVAYFEFPIPYFPFIPNAETALPPSPHPSEITYQQVRDFILSPFRASMATKTAKERIRAEMLFWHPDKFQSKFLRLMKPEDKDIAMETVNVLARILTQIKEEVENEEWKAKDAKEKAGAA